MAILHDHERASLAAWWRTTDREAFVIFFSVLGGFAVVLGLPFGFTVN